MKINHAIIFYDASCGLCQRTVLFILRHDRDAVFRFAALQSKIAKQTLQSLRLVSSPKLDTIILLENAEIYFRSAAFLRIFKNLGWPWKFFAVFRYFPRVVRDFVYQSFTRFRYQLFGKKAPLVIPEKWRERFLDTHEQKANLFNSQAEENGL